MNSIRLVTNSVAVLLVLLGGLFLAAHAHWRRKRRRRGHRTSMTATATSWARSSSP